MSIPSFHHSSLKPQDSVVSLDAKEASHAAKSRRLRVGQRVRLFNGFGLVALGALSLVERRTVMVELDSFEQLDPPARRVSIAVAIPKGDRQKVMVDILTQLGVFEIIPVRCRYSETKFNDNTAEKWLRVSIEACKQSQNPWMPRIASEQDLDQLLGSLPESSDNSDPSSISSLQSNHSLTTQHSQRNLVVANTDGECLLSLAQSNSDVTVLIGPEGGFSEQEFSKLRQFSVPSMRIGPYILRTEAAAISAASMLVG
jgi:16S rRNA (uracil1498-N3)-methyltransferase